MFDSIVAEKVSLSKDDESTWRFFASLLNVRLKKTSFAIERVSTSADHIRACTLIILSPERSPKICQEKRNVDNKGPYDKNREVVIDLRTNAVEPLDIRFSKFDAVSERKDSQSMQAEVGGMEQAEPISRNKKLARGSGEFITARSFLRTHAST
jgi:hypothetical protein